MNSQLNTRTIILIALLLIFNWNWSYNSIGLSSSYSSTLHNYLKDRHTTKYPPKLILKEASINIPWTRYLPIYQFGEIEGYQETEITYKGGSNLYTYVNLSNRSRRVGVLPDFILRRRILENLEQYILENTEGHNGHSFDFAE